MANFNRYLHAGYPALWVTTHEERRAIETLSAEAEGYTILQWDMVNGITIEGMPMTISKGLDGMTVKASDKPDNKPDNIADALIAMPEGSVLFVKDMHRLLQPPLIRRIKNALPACESGDKHIVFVSPVPGVITPSGASIPPELARDITHYEFALPSISELIEVANDIVSGNNLSLEVAEQLVQAGKGLTISEFRDAFSLAVSIGNGNGISRKVIEDQKTQAVKRMGLEIHEPVPLSQFKGADLLVSYMQARAPFFTEQTEKARRVKGILLVGPPGTGKSTFCKVVSSLLQSPLIRVDSSNLKGSLVGESERKTKEVWRIAKAVSPCILWFDEIEKMFSGSQSSGKTDGGSSAGMFQIMLSELQENTELIYVVATCNDMDILLNASQGALIRRFDDTFFVDLPNLEERKSILSVMNCRYGTEISEEIATQLEGWSGAEIEKLCRGTIYEGLDVSLSNIRTVYSQNSEVINRAREWASNNARLATAKEQVKQTTVRRVK